ncbi:DA1-related 5 [Spatholobus suberectus]|nr:DA1-related 5 [Spatholobus suberectus]
MADLFSGGAVGAVMGELLKGAIATVNKGREFKPTLESNIETLKSLSPVVEEMKRYNNMLDRPVEEIKELENHVRDGQQLVDKCSKFSLWRVASFPFYQSKLRRKDEALKRHLSVNVSAQNKRDLMEIVLSVRQILEILLKKEDFRQYQGYQLMGLSGAPQEPECMGMDEPMNKLRIGLLKDGVSVIVLTGLGGSGKSTLAKKICWHPQVKDTIVITIALASSPPYYTRMKVMKVAKEADMYYNNHFVMLHDFLRELAIHQSEEEPFEQRKRLIVDLNGDNRPEWWVGQNQQGIIGRMFSFFLGMLVGQKQLGVGARILSISTGVILIYSSIAASLVRKIA